MDAAQVIAEVRAASGESPASAPPAAVPKAAAPWPGPSTAGSSMGDTVVVKITPKTPIWDYMAGRGIKPDALLALMAVLGAEEDEHHTVELDAILGLGDFPDLVGHVQPPLVRGRLVSAWRSAVEELLNAPKAPSSTGKPSVSDTAETAAPQETLKIAEFLVQQDEARFALLPTSEIAAARSRYRSLTGGDPLPQAVPTDEQLSALNHQVVKRGKSPFVDLSLFGAYGNRFVRTHRSSAHRYVGNGEWATRLLPTVRTHESWKDSWAVFTAAMVMLGLATLNSLTAYAHGLERLVRHHRDWHTVSGADEKMREEVWTKLRSDALAQLVVIPGFDANSPWDSIIRYTAWSVGCGLQDWWFEQVVAPLTFHKSNVSAAISAAEGLPRGQKRGASPNPTADQTGLDTTSGGRRNNNRRRQQTKTKNKGNGNKNQGGGNGKGNGKGWLKPRSKKAAK